MRLRKTLKSSTRRWLAPLFIAGVTGVLLASCAAPPSRGDNVAQINEAPLPSADASLLQGYISQTRVDNATVCYDMYDAALPGFSNTCDFGEASAQSTANGSYTLTLGGFQQTQDYQLLATGGTAKSITSTAETVGVMLAPRGARNITPLTTLVALDSDLAAKIEQEIGTAKYSEKYDVDIAKSGGTYGEHLMLAKGIETFMYVFGRSNPNLTIVSSTQGHVQALTYLANRLDNLTGTDIFDATQISAQIEQAALDVMDTTNAGRPNATAVNSLNLGVLPAGETVASLASDVASAASAVMAEISTGTGIKLTEDSVISACSSAFASTNLVSDFSL